MLAGSEGPLLVNLQPTGSGYYYGDASVMGMGIKAMPPGIMQADGQWAADALPLHHYDHRQQAALYYQHSTALRVAQHVAAPPNVLLPGGHGTLPQDHMGWNNTQPGPDVGHAVGWGGQTIADSRPKMRGQNRRAGGSRSGGRRNPDKGDKRMTNSGQGGSSGGGSARYERLDDRSAVEEVLRAFQGVPTLKVSGGKAVQMISIPREVFEALEGFDGRRLAFLLKEMAHCGMAPHAMQLFDSLQGMNGSYPLGHLCDTYSFTAMVSVCIPQQDVRRAVSLVNEMKRRGVECSVHTYTALMNVCIKCGKGNLALEAYSMLLQDGLQPNVITYNTLVDVYGKMGQWEKAIEVLQIMGNAGVLPVLRTYNTLMIACNICSQPREALRLYDMMRSKGFSPNATTYNTLITAYGKVGQLDRALEVFREMHGKGYPRSVVTYSTLISACERVGQWRRALDLFAEMRPDGCAPNTVTFNSLIKACAQGGQWEKALELFEAMGGEGCRPDVVTFTALINACDKGGQWRTALAMFERMRSCGCKPDSIVYNAVIDCLWETGVVAAQCEALCLFHRAQKDGHFAQHGLLDLVRIPNTRRLEVNLHAQTAGVAMLGLYCWLLALRSHVMQAGNAPLPPVLAVVTDSGRGAREMANNVVKGAVTRMMPSWGAPFRAPTEGSHSQTMEASGAAVEEWLLSPIFEAQLPIFFPCAAYLPEIGSMPRDRSAGAPPTADIMEPRCSEAFAAVKRFEQTHSLSLQTMGLSYLENRPELVTFALGLGSQLSLGQEVVHDAVLLMDRVASTGCTLQNDSFFLVMAACMKVAANRSREDGNLVDGKALEAATAMPASSLVRAEHDLYSILNGDTAAISALRCVQVYLERMGCDFKDPKCVELMVSQPTHLANESLMDVGFLNCRPSMVAAGILYTYRRCRGIVPCWPSVLAKMTGYRDMNSPELTVAVKSAQRLCAKTMGMPHRTASSQASDSMSSTPFGGSPVQGSSPIMWGSSTPLGSSPTHSGSSYAYMPPLDLATVPQLSALALQYHTGGSSPNGLSPSASPPGGSSPRSVQSFMELSFGGLSLGQ